MMTHRETELIEGLRSAIRDEHQALGEREKAYALYEAAADRVREAENAVTGAKMDLLRAVCDSALPRPGFGLLED